MEICGIKKSSIRMTPAGFCWTFEGKEVEGRAVRVELHFDFIWFGHLARDLRAVLDGRDAETEKARNVLRGE